jgi:predicted TIM-barrel fold metal-dependent hydrolase
MTQPIISADSHVFEPPDLWQSRVGSEYRDRAPRVAALKDGGEAMLFDDGSRIPYVGFGSAGDRGRTSAVMPLDQVRSGGWDPAARLRDMDADGIQAEVLYPSFGMRLFNLQDAGLQLACMRAYNDWLAEYFSAAPERLLGQALLPLDVDAALGELERIGGRGFRGVVLSGHPAPEQDYGTDRYERLWAALQDRGLPASLHVFTGPHEAERRYFLADYTLATGLVQRSLVLLLFSGVLERYPGLRIISAENDIGWVAHLLSRMDHAFVRKGPRYPSVLRGDLLPSELFKRQVRCTFMDDRAGILTREITGPDVLMWASDYPHDDSTWPESQKVLERLLTGVPEAERHRIVYANAASLFGLD